jgi:hypothetical protein
LTQTPFIQNPKPKTLHYLKGAEISNFEVKQVSKLENEACERQNENVRIRREAFLTYFIQILSIHYYFSLGTSQYLVLHCTQQCVNHPYKKIAYTHKKKKLA